MTANFATALRSTDWTRNFEGAFRVVVIDRCPNCQVEQAHTVETDDRTSTGKCQVCFAIVSYISPRIPAKGEYIGFKGAHPNNLYEVLEADERGAIIDFIGSYRVVSPNSWTFHAECTNTWCHACTTFVDTADAGFIRVRRSTNQPV